MILLKYISVYCINALIVMCALKAYHSSLVTNEKGENYFKQFLKNNII